MAVLALLVAAAAVADHGTGRITRSGRVRRMHMFDSELTVELRTAGMGEEVFKFCLLHDVFTKSAVVTTPLGTRPILDEERPATYSACDGRHGVLTFTSAMQAQATVITSNDDVYDVDFHLASGHSHHGHSDECDIEATNVTDGMPMMACRADALNLPPMKLAGTHGHSPPIAMQQLDQYVFANCYTGQTQGEHVMEMGIALGANAIKAIGASTKEQLAYVNQVVHTASYFVYEWQLGIKLVVEHIDAAATGKWATCSSTINVQLEEFGEHTFSDNGRMWHLIDNCWNAAGLAYVGYVCNPNWHTYAGENEVMRTVKADRAVTHMGYGTAFSDHAPRGTWQTFAHETGHVIGANHPFSVDSGESAYGKHGGIMDYICSGAASCSNNPYSSDLRIEVDGSKQWMFNMMHRSEVCPVLNYAIRMSCSYFHWPGHTTVTTTSTSSSTSTLSLSPPAATTGLAPPAADGTTTDSSRAADAASATSDDWPGERIGAVVFVGLAPAVAAAAFVFGWGSGLVTSYAMHVVVSVACVSAFAVWVHFIPCVWLVCDMSDRDKPELRGWLLVGTLGVAGCVAITLALARHLARTPDQKGMYSLL